MFAPYMTFIYLFRELFNYFLYITSNKFIVKTNARTLIIISTYPFGPSCFIFIACKKHTIKISQGVMVIMFKYCQGNVTKISDLYWEVKEYEKQVSDFRYWLLSKITTVKFWVSLLEYLKQRRILLLLTFYAKYIINILKGK